MRAITYILGVLFLLFVIVSCTNVETSEKDYETTQKICDLECGVIWDGDSCEYKYLSLDQLHTITKTSKDCIPEGALKPVKRQSVCDWKYYNPGYSAKICEPELRVSEGAVQDAWCYEQVAEQKQILLKDGLAFTFWPTGYRCETTQAVALFESDQLSFELYEGGFGKSGHGGTTARYDCYATNDCKGDMCQNVVLGRKFGGGVTSILIDERCIDENTIFSVRNLTVKTSCFDYMKTCMDTELWNLQNQ